MAERPLPELDRLLEATEAEAAQLTRILNEAVPGNFSDKPHNLFIRLAHALEAAGLDSTSMQEMYWRIGPLLEAEAEAARLREQVRAWHSLQRDLDRLGDLLSTCEGASPISHAIWAIEEARKEIARLEAELEALQAKPARVHAGSEQE